MTSPPEFIACIFVLAVWLVVVVLVIVPVLVAVVVVLAAALGLVRFSSVLITYPHASPPFSQTRYTGRFA